MTIICVDDVKLHGHDPAASRIVEVYSKNAPYYAVYRTATRVVVHYADDPELARAQRTLLAPLHPILGLINSLMGGWSPGKTARFARGVADALIVALEGDAHGAELILQNVKQEIIDERTSWARFLYLIVASLTALALIAGSMVAHSKWICDLINLPEAGRSIWLAGGGGAIGAFFSIATAMRRRTVLTDLQWLDNAADAVLRVFIGGVAGMVLYCLLQAHLVNLSIGMLDPKATPAERWMFIIVVGFVAGFLERLVPDLLEKSTLVTASSAHPAPPPSTAPDPGARKAPPPPVPPAVMALHAAAEAEGDEHLCGVGVTPQEATPDHLLPAAIGGVAAPA